MWRLYRLADESETAAARQYHKAYGEEVAQQNLGKRVQLAQEVWRLFGLQGKNSACAAPQRNPLFYQPGRMPPTLKSQHPCGFVRICTFLHGKGMQF
jgi:outer membrane PBP1 activator LpoA protein